MRAMKILASLLVAGLALTACTSDDETSQDREAEARQTSYDQLVANQPADSMTYSPTRETVNFWVETWNEPGKLSFVYLQSANGDLIGYYVLEGLPVSYCAMLTPTYEFVDLPGDGDSHPEHQVPAPGIDGAYYSGGQCDTYYGRDATTGSYIEYTAGLGINVLLFEEPMPRQNVEPLGPTTVEDVD